MCEAVHRVQLCGFRHGIGAELVALPAAAGSDMESGAINKGFVKKPATHGSQRARSDEGTPWFALRSEAYLGQ